MRKEPVTVLMIASLLSLSFALAQLPCLAKKWTVTERIEKLSSDIDAGRKANELTVKQVDTLKKMVADINEKIEKMKAKNGGKLSVPDTKKLHDQMTGLSVKLLKMQLDNVYSD